jgi:hypothetical protein
LEGISRETCSVVYELGSIEGNSTPSETLTIIRSYDLDLSFLATKGWQTLEDLSIINSDLQNNALHIPETVKKFRYEGSKPLSLDIASEQVSLEFRGSAFPTLFFKEGNVKHVSLGSTHGLGLVKPKTSSILCPILW